MTGRTLPLAAAALANDRLAGKTGRRFWRALDDLAGEPAFAAAVTAEFPAAFAGVEGASRRQLLKAMGASLGLAGLAACSDQPDAQAMPYVRTPEMLVPDRARHYATAVIGPGGYAQPVLGTTHMGRPTKLEGLPDHPASLGAADAYTQAAILGLYDPDRSKAPRRRGRTVDWGVLDAEFVANAARLDTRRGEGLRLLTGQQTSPTFARQVAALTARWPLARWHVFEPVEDAASPPKLDKADVVVSLDEDFLGHGPRQVRNARLWSARRRAFQAGVGQHRLFVAEPAPTLTGVQAEDRLPVTHGRIGILVQALAAAFGSGEAPAGLSGPEQAWAAKAAAALRAAPGRGLVLVGAGQPAAVRAMGLALNVRAGGADLLPAAAPVALAPPDGAASFARLVRDMAAGAVDTLMIFDANPAYAAPADIPFVEALARVRLAIHAGLHWDETARLCGWHAPIEHDLETWSDARAVDGTVSLIQPLVRPFYAVRSRHALIEGLMGRPGVQPHDLVAQTWRDAWGGDFDRRWPAALTAGLVEGPASEASAGPAPAIEADEPPPVAPDAGGLELIFRPDPSVWDGRYANNPWLQELPKPLTTLTWDNVVQIAPALGDRLGVKTGDVVRVTAGGRNLEAACWINPGQAAQTVVATLGYGRRVPEQVGDGHGYDAYALRTAAAPWAMQGVVVERTGRRRKLAVTQPFADLQASDYVRTMSRAEAARPKPPKARPPSFYPDKPEEGPQWGMSVDTDVCIGCNACVTACDAENNVAMVGKDLTAQGRTMHWLRIDHYYAGPPSAPEMFFQPVPCMHCEQAPCEMGCPVHATVHGTDGLNLQVYNRCIGTRTCSSYCPYKVRHFNFFDYTKFDPPEHRAQRNPNVTVRSRGVMEKCTYCIQRVSEARIQAKIENRPIRDGEVRTACQQTCPTDAIVFGDIRDPQSAVSRRKASARDYVLLEEANTRPRTTYLARIRDEGEAG